MPTQLTLPNLLHASSSPALLLLSQNQILTHSQLKTLVETLASALFKLTQNIPVDPNGLNRPSIITSFNDPFLSLLSFLACTSARCVAAPLNPNYKCSENLFYINDLKPSLALSDTTPDSEFSNSCAQSNTKLLSLYFDASLLTLTLNNHQLIISSMPSPQVDDDALVLHTSGTTGRPKAVPLTHRNICYSVRNIAKHYDLNEKDRTICIMPLFHVHGLIGVSLTTLLTKGCIILPLKFSKTKFWKWMINYEPTWFSGVPTMHQLIIDELKNQKNYKTFEISIKKLRFVRSCSSALSLQTEKQMRSIYKRVVQAYAMTECSHQICSTELNNKIEQTVGFPIGVQISIRSIDDDIEVNEGEICVKGESVTKGYLRNPEANAKSFTKSGWFRTGDLGYFSANSGGLEINGRISERINRGGEKIDPSEIDAILLSIEGVKEAIVFGVESTIYGQEVEAVVVLEEENKMEGIKKIIDQLLRNKLTKFKIPRKIYYVKEIPKGPTGKIQRKLIAKHFSERFSENRSRL